MAGAGRLPFAGLNNGAFNNMVGGNRAPRLPQQHRRSVIGNSEHLARYWHVEEIPMDEPSNVYTHRLEASFLTSYIVPPAPRDQDDEEAIAEFDPIIDSLFPVNLNSTHYALRPFWNRYRPAQLRIYFLHPDGSIQVLPNGDPRRYGGTTFVNSEEGMTHLRTAFASTLGDFVDRYQNEDIHNGDLQYIRLYIDFAPGMGGGARPALLPRTIPQDIGDGVIWNPDGVGGCGFKCLTQAVRFEHKGLTWKALKQQLQVEDGCDYTVLLEK